MTINSAVNKTIALGNGSQTQFAFGFIGVAAAYISVIFTDSSGNETVLSQGAGATQYQIALNSAVQGALWGIGGMVTYNPSGSPIPNGSSLTIVRTLPLTQAVSLQNQISLAELGNGAETGLDTLEMQIQQISENINRAITAPIVDPPTINLVLPPAAQRANTGIAFDGSGNVIAGTTPATGLISTAMQPVVDASTLAVGRAAFGLGAMATEGIGAGLIDDGAGKARVNNPVTQVASNQTVLASFDLERFIATGPINFTFQAATQYWNGFGFWVEAVTGDVTLVPNFTDNFQGYASGVPFTVPAGAKVFVTTDAASSGIWYVEGLTYLVPLARTATGNYAIGASDNAKILAFQDGTQQIIGFPAANTLPSDFRCLIINSDSTLVGKRVSGLGSNFIMYPGQAYTIQKVAGVLTVLGGLKRWVLEQSTTFYVDPAAGGSFNDGLAPGAARAFASPQIGVDSVCNNLDVNRQNVVLQLADSTYTTPIHLYSVLGFGTIGGHSELIIQGNMGSPQNCLISVSNSNCFSMVGVTTPWRIQGFEMTVTSGVGNCIAVDGSSFCYIGASNNFGACPNSHISVSFKSFVEAVGLSYNITGSAASHVNANVSSLADMVSTQITLVGSIGFSGAFAIAEELSDITFQLCSFVGSATGQRYLAVLNSVINTGGGGSGFLPGSSAGSTTTGGQYG